jgi:protein O-mannosyl-transferase
MTAVSPTDAIARDPVRRRLGAVALQAAALVLITFCAYLPTLKNGFIWDDDRYVEQNRWLHRPDGLWHIWFQYDSEPQYYPLTHTAFWTEYHLWGLHPLGYHVDNLILQIANALLLWRLLVQLQIPGAWLAAMLFAIHPVQVETVAWATERKNLLSALFYFLSLRAYFKTGFVDWIQNPTSGDRSASSSGQTIQWLWYISALLLFILALLSKSVSSSLPAVILLLAWWKRGSLRPRDIYPLIPFFLAGLWMGALTSWMEKYVVGAIGPVFSAITPADRICIAGRVIWFYLLKLVIPLKLTFIYPRWNIPPSPPPWLYLFPASVTLFLISLWLLRYRIGRGPLCAALFFVGTLVPALGFVDVFPMRYSFVADHFQYLACIGPFALFAAGVARVQIARLNLGTLASLVIIPPLAFLSFEQTQIYKDRLTLWQYSVDQNPASPMAHDNLAAALRDRGELDTAEAEYHKAIDLRTDQMDYIGLGQCSALRHDYDGAIAWYQKSLATTPDSDIQQLHRLRVIPWFQMGTAYDGAAQQDVASHLSPVADRNLAIQSYLTALTYDPAYHDARLNLAADYLEVGNFASAVKEAQTVLYNDLDSVPALNILGATYARSSRYSEAAGYYEKALDIDSNDVEALVSLGIIRALQGDLPRAQEYFESALKLDPDNALAKHNLSAILSKRAQPNP